MTYKDLLTQAMTELGKDPLFRVVAYNCTPPGGSGGGSFNGVPLDQRIEMPLAEANMAGVAIGLSLAGFHSLIFLERFDFIYRALDPLALHLDKLAQLSDGIHKPACIIRVVIGKRTTPLFTEPTHTSDLTRAMCEILSFRVVKLMWKDSILSEYERALSDLKMYRKSTMLIEDADLYNQ